MYDDIKRVFNNTLAANPLPKKVARRSHDAVQFEANFDRAVKIQAFDAAAHYAAKAYKTTDPLKLHATLRRAGIRYNPATRQVEVK